MTNTINPPKKKAANIQVEKLRSFERHPFKVLNDEDMNNLTESIKAQGIISPLIVRPIENTDEYEVISGHRRLHAAVKAGLSEVPALIYPLDRNEAMIAVDIYFTAAGMIDIPTEQELLAMMEEIRENPQDFRFVA